MRHDEHTDRRRRAGHARVLRPGRDDRAGRPAHEGGRGARRARWSRSPRASSRRIPDWVWRTTPWADGEWYARWFDQARRRARARRATRSARSRARTVSTSRSPVNERDGGTVYNTILYFGPDGALLGKHRKLVATGGERLVWGQGDGSTLPVIDTPFGRVGGLICWENYMPLARAAMYEQGVDILLAPTWDNSDVWVASMRHIAKEGRCYVLGITSCLRGSDVPADIPGRDEHLRRRRRLDVARQHGHRRSRTATVLAGPLTRDRRHPLRRGRHRRRCAGRAASSTSSATTRGPTCSASRCAATDGARGLMEITEHIDALGARGSAARGSRRARRPRRRGAAVPRLAAPATCCNTPARCTAGPRSSSASRSGTPRRSR